MTVEDYLSSIRYTILSINDVSNVKAYLSSCYNNVTVGNVKNILAKGASVGAYRGKSLIGCYLLDITIHIDKAPDAEVVYIKADYEEVLGAILDKLTYLSGLHINSSDDVKKYLKIDDEYGLLKLCYNKIQHIDDIVGMKDKKVIKEFKRDLRLEYYTGKDKDKLLVLVKAYHEERNKDTFLGDLSKIAENLSEDESFIDTMIVVVKDVATDDIAGFVRYAIVDEYGATTPYVYGEYVYVAPKYRKGLTLPILYGYLCHLARKLNTVVRWDVFDGTTNQDVSTRVLNSTKITEGYRLCNDQVNEIASKYWDKFGVDNG